MNTFFILLSSSIKQIWKNQKGLYFLFIIFMVVSFFSIFFLENLIVNFYKYTKTYYMDRVCNVEINDSQNLENQLDNFLNQNNEILESINLTEIISQEKYITRIKTTYFSKDQTSINLDVGRWFNESEIANGENVIIAPISICDFSRKEIETLHYEIGDSFFLDEKEYKVIGLTYNSNNEFRIPFNTIEDFSNFSNMEIALNKLMNEESTLKFRNNISQSFDCNIKNIPKFSKNEDNKFFILSAIILASFGLGNMVFLYKYILDTRKEILGLFRVYGYSNKKSTQYFYFELLILFFVCLLFSILAFLIIMNSINSQIFLYVNSLKFSSYIFTIFALWVFYSLLFVPKIKQFVNSMPKEIME